MTCPLQETRVTGVVRANRVFLSKTADLRNAHQKDEPIMRAMKNLAPTILLIAAIAVPQWVAAQEEAADEITPKNVIEEVLTTATRVETDVMTTAIAVSAFNQETLTRDGVKDIRDAADMVPNFDVAFSPSDSGVQLTLRGINSNNFTEIADPSVAFHVDGVYSPRPQGAVALMFDLERLEVMRGPQGTLFGRNSAAGSINVVTAKPTTEGIFGTFGIEMGNREQQNALGTLNLPITDTFALRGNFFVETRDGFADQDTGHKDLEGRGFEGPDGIPDMDQRRNRRVHPEDFYGNSDRWAWRVSGLWEPNDRFDFRLSFEQGQDNSAGWPTAPNCEVNPELCRFNGGGIDYVDPNIPGTLDMSMDAVRSHINYALTDNIDLVYNFGWARQQRAQEWDADMGWRPVPGPTTGWLNRYQPWPSLYLATAESDYKSYSNELQFQGLTGPVNWIVGLFDFREDNSIIFDVELPFCCSHGGLGGISFKQPERTLESQAIFGQATWHLTDQWHLTIGGRYTEDTREDVGGRNIGAFGSGTFSQGLIPNDGHPTPAQLDELVLPLFTSAEILQGFGAQNRDANYSIFDINDNKASFYQSNWRIGLDYDLNSDSFLYAYAATGSKAGSFGDGVDVCRCGRIEIFNFEPEEVLNYEVGYKTTLLDGSMNLVVTAFLTDFDNKQVAQFRTVGVVEDPPGTPVIPEQEIGNLVTTNAGKAEIKGLEVEFDWIPWDNGRFTGGLGLLNAEFKSWPGYVGEAFFCDDRADAGPEFACIPQDDGSGVNNIEGKKLPYSTPVSLTLAYEHNFYLKNNASLTPYVKFHWEDETHFNEGNFDALPQFSQRRDAFGTLDATLRYTSPDETWNVEAFVYNATDERFPIYLSDQGSRPMFAWNAPRSWGIRAARHIRN